MRRDGRGASRARERDNHCTRWQSGCEGKGRWELGRSNSSSTAERKEAEAALEMTEVKEADAEKSVI